MLIINRYRVSVWLDEEGGSSEEYKKDWEKGHEAERFDAQDEW